MTLLMCHYESSPGSQMGWHGSHMPSGMRRCYRLLVRAAFSMTPILRVQHSAPVRHIKHSASPRGCELLEPVNGSLCAHRQVRQEHTGRPSSLSRGQSQSSKGRNTCHSAHTSWQVLQRLCLARNEKCLQNGMSCPAHDYEHEHAARVP